MAISLFPFNDSNKTLMKLRQIQLSLLLIVTSLFLSGCSMTKVIDSWKSEDASDIKSKKTLVIARTNNPKGRKAFEDAIDKQLKNNNIDSEVSYNFILDVNPDEKLTEAEVTKVKKDILAKGFSAVVLTVLKDKKSTISVSKDGGYYAGATYSSELHPMLYDFYGYYGHAYSMPSARYNGNYVEESFNEQESVTYVIETLIFDLEKPSKEQLVALVTSSIEDPVSASDIATGYAKTIVQTLKK
jgi:hypothetical protein